MNPNKPRTRPAATMEIDAAHLVNVSDPTLPTKATPAALIVCGGSRYVGPSPPPQLVPAREGARGHKDEVGELSQLDLFQGARGGGGGVFRNRLYSALSWSTGSLD